MEKVDWYGTLNLWGHLSWQTKHRSQKGPNASEYEKTQSLSLKSPITLVCKDKMNAICKVWNLYHSKCLIKVWILWNLKSWKVRVESCHIQSLNLL